MKYLAICVLLAGAGLDVVEAQPAPPPPPATGNPAPLQSVTGTVSQLNYGPEGEINGFVCSNGVLLHIPEDWAPRLENVTHAGQSVRAQGYVMTAASGMQVIDVQTLSMAGRSFSVVQPSQPAPYAGNGVIQRLNYGPQGEINGFVCSNGLFAKTPPYGANNDSVLKPGANIALSGFAHTTTLGKTVVDVQSITVNGQTIALNTVTPEPPGPGLARRGPRSADAPPPPPAGPPPAPPQAQ